MDAYKNICDVALAEVTHWEAILWLKTYQIWGLRSLNQKVFGVEAAPIFIGIVFTTLEVGGRDFVKLLSFHMAEICNLFLNPSNYSV